MRKIRDKIALVTGAASGIGRAIALRLAREGAHLFLLDINVAELSKVVHAAKQLGVEAVGNQCDVSDPKQIARSSKQVLNRWGTVDILVNNAGITYYGQTEKMSQEHWDRLLAINLHGPIHFTRELLPVMLDNREAHVLNVASICGLVGLGRVTAYTTSKFALVGFSESLRAEYGRRGLGVTALCPGLVDTNLFSSAPLANDSKKKKLPPKFLLATPEKIAARAVKAIYRNQGVVVMQPYARLLHLSKRYCPWLLDRLHHVSRRRQKIASTDSPQMQPQFGKAA